MPNKRHVIVFIIGLSVGVPGVAILVGTHLWARGIKADAARFKTVEATMLKCRLVTHKSSSSLRVRYRYKVHGKTYHSEKLRRHPGGGAGASSDTRFWESLEERFRVGKRVTAWYDPNDPSEAYLINNSSFPLISILYGVAGILLLGAVVLFPLAGWWRRKRARLLAQRPG